MDFLDLAEKRYSCRSYADKKVEQEKIDKILKAANLAPTARNQQPVKLKVISSPEDLERLKEVTPCHFNAPLAILTNFLDEDCWHRPENGQSSGFVDASIVETHMMLEAADLGLGTCWVLKFSQEKAKELYNLPDEFTPAGLLIIGYPSEGDKPNQRHFERKGERELTF